MYTTNHIKTRKSLGAISVRTSMVAALYIKIMYGGESLMNTAVTLGWDGSLMNEKTLFEILDHCNINKF